MNYPPLRSINIIEGTTASGKTTALFETYRETVKKSRSVLISFEEKLQEKFRADEFEAISGCIDSIPYKYKTLEDFIFSLNKLIEEYNVEYVFVDMVNLSSNNCEYYDSSKIFDHLRQVKSNITATIATQIN